AASIGCPGCHLAYFQGDGTTARLAGQNHDYLIKKMTDFCDGTRGNNPGMSDLMKATSPDDLAALAQYLAGLQIDAYLNQGQYSFAPSELLAQRRERGEIPCRLALLVLEGLVGAVG